jgi:hypothetical protein
MFGELKEWQAAMEELSETVASLETGSTPHETAASIMVDAERSARLAAAHALVAWMKARAVARAIKGEF